MTSCEKWPENFEIANILEFFPEMIKPGRIIGPQNKTMEELRQMTTTEPKYDVAISFLNQDEPLAVKIQTRLSESMEVFVYSKKQQELAGTDGLESFRVVFREASRVVVVLYRNGWGQTPWTRVEETAITERALKQGWEWLLFVMLNSGETPPGWLPETRIRLNFADYSLEQLLGAIKIRAEKLGSSLKTETALDRAKRLEQESQARKERDRILAEEGMEAAQKEFNELLQILDRKIQDIAAESSSLNIKIGHDAHGCLLRTEHISVGLFLKGLVKQSWIVLQEFDRPLILYDPGRRMFPGDEPQVLSTNEFPFDCQPGIGWCWKHPSIDMEYLTTSELAEHATKTLLELQDRFERGKIVRPSRQPMSDTDENSSSLFKL